MITESSSKKYLTLSIICGVWFLLTGAVWVYFANLFIAYPMGVAGFLLWRKGKSKDNPRLSASALYLLIGGLAVSLATLLLLLISN